MKATGRRDEIAALDTALLRQRQFLDLVQHTRDELQAVYQSGAPQEVMREQKVDTYSRMREGYQALKQSWGGYTGYDRWFGNQLNNAKLASVSTYNQLVPDFARLLAEEGGDLQAFYRAVVELTKLSPEQRRARLAGEAVACLCCSLDTARG
jgi:predicted aminopeptidase